MGQGCSWRCLALLLLLLCAFAWGAATPTAAPIPLLAPGQVRLSLTSDPTTEIMVTWLCSANKGFVEYFPIAPGNTLADAVPATRTSARVYSRLVLPPETMDLAAHYVILTGLRPATAYKYRVTTIDGKCAEFFVANLVADEGQEYHSSSFEFKTAAERELGTDTQIAIFADQGTWGTVEPFMNFLARSIDIELAFHLGDLSYGTSEAVWNKWGMLVEPIASRIPYMVLPGNWDAKLPWMKLFRHRFYTPALAPSNDPLSYHYTLSYHLFQFIMINSYENYSAGSEQYIWLERELARAASNRHLRPWIVVGFHSPIYSSSSGHSGGDKDFGSAIEPLLAQYSVDLCFTGHDHGYERSYPVFDYKFDMSERTVYKSPHLPIHLLVGVAGATPDPWQPEQPGWSLYRELGAGYVKLHAFTNWTLHVQLLRVNGTVGDEFWLVRSPESWLSRVDPDRKACLLLAIVFLLFPAFLLCRMCFSRGSTRSAPRGLTRTPDFARVV